MDSPKTDTVKITRDQLAWALCKDARVLGYDHGASPTVDMTVGACPRHISLAYSLLASIIEETARKYEVSKAPRATFAPEYAVASFNKHEAEMVAKWSPEIQAFAESLKCPAAKHHRLRKFRAAKIVDWDEFGPVYGVQELEVDRCTACGFDFTGENK